MLCVNETASKRASITSSLLETGAYSDLVIECKDKVWKVHKAIVLLSSKPLDDKFNKISGDTLDLNEDQPEIVEHMLDFLYNEDYCDHYESDGSVNALLTNAFVYILASKYRMESLQALAIRKYEEVMPEGWNSYPFIESLRILYENDEKSDEILKGVSVEAVESAGKTSARHGDVALDVLAALLSNGQKRYSQPVISSRDTVWHCRHCSRVYY